MQPPTPSNWQDLINDVIPYARSEIRPPVREFRQPENKDLISKEYALALVDEVKTALRPSTLGRAARQVGESMGAVFEHGKAELAADAAKFGTGVGVTLGLGKAALLVFGGAALGAASLGTIFLGGAGFLGGLAAYKQWRLDRNKEEYVKHRLAGTQPELTLLCALLTGESLHQLCREVAQLSRCRLKLDEEQDEWGPFPGSWSNRRCDHVVLLVWRWGCYDCALRNAIKGSRAMKQLIDLVWRIEMILDDTENVLQDAVAALVRIYVRWLIPRGVGAAVPLEDDGCLKWKTEVERNDGTLAVHWLLIAPDQNQKIRAKSAGCRPGLVARLERARERSGVDRDAREAYHNALAAAQSVPGRAKTAGMAAAYKTPPSVLAQAISSGLAHASIRSFAVHASVGIGTGLLGAVASAVVALCIDLLKNVLKDRYAHTILTSQSPLDQRLEAYRVLLESSRLEQLTKSATNMPTSMEDLNDQLEKIEQQSKSASNYTDVHPLSELWDNMALSVYSIYKELMFCTTVVGIARGMLDEIIAYYMNEQINWGPLGTQSNGRMRSVTNSDHRQCTGTCYGQDVNGDSIFPLQ
jgi:hypothetical protein